MKTLILFSDIEAVSVRFLHYTTCIIGRSINCFGDVLQSDCWCSGSGRHTVSPLSAEPFSIFPSCECVSPLLKGSCGFTMVQDVTLNRVFGVGTFIWPLISLKNQFICIMSFTDILTADNYTECIRDIVCCDWLCYWIYMPVSCITYHILMFLYTFLWCGKEDIMTETESTLRFDDVGVVPGLILLLWVVQISRRWSRKWSERGMGTRLDKIYSSVFFIDH